MVTMPPWLLAEMVPRVPSAHGGRGVHHKGQGTPSSLLNLRDFQVSFFSAYSPVHYGPGMWEEPLDRHSDSPLPAPSAATGNTLAGRACWPAQTFPAFQGSQVTGHCEARLGSDRGPSRPHRPQGSRVWMRPTCLCLTLVWWSQALAPGPGPLATGRWQ